MYYKVTLLDTSVDKSVAEVVAYQNGEAVSIQVISENPKMKAHLETLLAKDAFIMAPGRNSARLYSDGVLHLYPNTLHYFQALPEILSWRGYNAAFVNETHKSMTWYEDEVFVLKSADDNIYQNAAGERIVKVVPQGYVAVNNDGRTVAAGRWLNANIDKEGADWTLVPNPYETMQPQKREEERSYMDMGLQKYHPGAYDEVYQARQQEDEPYYQAKEGYKPSKGKTLAEHYAQLPQGEEKGEIKKTPPQNLPLEIPTGKILYSPDAGYAIASGSWPPDQIPDYQKYDWYVFDAPDLSDEEKAAYAGMMGESPSLIRGLDTTGIVKVPEKLDVSEGFKLNFPSMSDMSTIGVVTGIVLNPLKPQTFDITEMTSSDYKDKARTAQKKLSQIKALTSVRDEQTGEMRISEELKDMEISELDGLSATWRANFDGREYQKAGILALVEPSQYEIFGGPKGWHGHFLTWKFGLGKGLRLNEKVLTPRGWVENKDLTIGQEVVGKDGKACKVVGIYPQGCIPNYKITFNDGTEIITDGAHQWFTKTFKDRANEKQRKRFRPTAGKRGQYKRAKKEYGSVKTTEEIMQTLYHKTAQGSKLNHSIPMVEPIQFTQEYNLPIAPYYLGVILGDGNITDSSRYEVDFIDSSNKEYLKTTFVDTDQRHSDTKFIPREYLYASLENRIALLQGLMDTDGHPGINSTGAEYTTASPQLAEDVRELVLSLGGKTSTSTGVGSYVDEDGERIMYKTKYRLHISFPEGIGFNPFRLPRKAANFGYCAANNWERFITDVVRVEDGETQCIAVDSPDNLFVTKDYIVTHNTAVVTGALAVLRNRGVITNGKQTTIVTAPNKNTYIWQNEVGKFLGEYAVVIDGDRSTRIEQWEDLLKKAQDNELPSMVIVGSSKFRFTRADDGRDTDEEDAWELDVDAQYMKLLAQGGRSGEREVKGNHIGVLAVDESGQYVNYDAARHHALKEIIDSVYNTRGLVWTLNGNISGNSATDTLSEISFVNAFARENYMTLAQEYTMTDRGGGRESKRMGRRIWKDYNRLRDFMNVFGSVIYPLSGKTVAGDNFGFVQTDDAGAPLGKNWGTVYSQAERKLRQSSDLGKMNRALGLASILINASFGATSPARLLEYDLGTDLLVSGVMKQLPAGDAMAFKREMQEYLSQATSVKNSLGIGRLPKEDTNVIDRNKMFRQIFSETSRDAMDAVLASWDAPILDVIMDGLDDAMKNHQGAGKPPLKMGTAGFSKRAINILYRKLKERYSEDKVLINIIDGDTPPESVNQQQTAHQREKDRFVISLVTGAGLYGLSLPAERSFRFPTWNSAKAGQYQGRFHRKAEQHNVSTVVVPDGIVQYMRELEQRKSEMAKEATQALIDADDEADEIELKNVGTLTSFIDKLMQYRPRILSRESGEQ